MIDFLLNQIPSPWLVEKIRSYILLENVVYADVYLSVAIVALTILALIQTKAFSRPPPVPLKVIDPSRPALQVLFKPEVSSKEVLDEYDDCVPSAQVGDNETVATTTTTTSTLTAASIMKSKMIQNLPDSFAPLLSSSDMEILWSHLTTDLIHGVNGEGNVLLKEGKHEIPFDKDGRRPQLSLMVGKGGCSVRGKIVVGSDRLSLEEDLDASVPSMSRSRPMVKECAVSLEPALHLSNVAPTLVHLPELWTDNLVPTLRRTQGVRALLTLLQNLSSFFERLLWCLERNCVIHLSKIQLKPIYRGKNKVNNTPHWRLSASFSGHVLLFGVLPIPFFNVTLPTFIIPAAHALLPNLCTLQPLASATLRRENINHEKIILALLNSLSDFNVSLKTLATPPAVEVDMKVSGGASIAVETMLGRDLTAAVLRNDNVTAPRSSMIHENIFPSSDSLSTLNSATQSNKPLRHQSTTVPNPFDANLTVPWLLDLSCNGTFTEDHIRINVNHLKAIHNNDFRDKESSHFITNGNIVIRRADPMIAPSHTKLVKSMNVNRLRSKSREELRLPRHTAPPQIFALLLFPDSIIEPTTTKQQQQYPHLLEYDYAFDIDGQIDAISLSVGASHPMLKGGTIVTTVLESIYALGSLTAREGAIMNPLDTFRKRNILRHLPAVDFTCGIGNAFIPEESMSFSDDGITNYIPELQGGRINIRIVGGFEKDKDSDVIGDSNSTPSTSNVTNSLISADGFVNEQDTVIAEGIKFITDFGCTSFTLHSSSAVDEFPELDILEGSKLVSLLSGTFSGRVSSHLRPQNVFSMSPYSSLGPNLYNPLEAFEIDFSTSGLSLKFKELWSTLGHRRVIFPTETTFSVNVVESVVDMSFDGQTSCELSWDFQGSSPMLQVSKNVDLSPADVLSHEDKKQIPLLISALRQGRLNFVVSPVGGISFRQAKTSRDYREGLYDWKFFNALVSPDHESSKRLLDILYDRPTIKKLIHIVNLINTELGKILDYITTQVWRAKDIFDEEGIEGPGHVIPGHKMARLVSLFLCGDDTQVDDILPIIQRVTAGDGLDVVKLKDLLRKNIDMYEEWAPEIDRAVRWAAVMLGPMAATQSYVESNAPPLSELPEYASKFQGIPSAKQLYETLDDNRSLPLDSAFSAITSQIAPYMSFKQVEYILQARPLRDWQPADLRRLRYVYSIKKKVSDISESYGGLSFLPQSFLVSVFLGEATRASLRARVRRKVKKVRSGASGGVSVASSMGKYSSSNRKMIRVSTLSTLRRQRLTAPSLPNGIMENATYDYDGRIFTPAERVASQQNMAAMSHHPVRTIHTHNMVREGDHSIFQGVDLATEVPDPYELGDSLLGPSDVATLLQAGLTSSMKGSTVVQLNQRMLLDLIASQPRSFAIGVLCELGNPGGQGSSRVLTSALMALLELDQKSFTPEHQLDMHVLLETFTGIKMPRRDHYLAGGRWARQSYYEALSLASKSILEDAEPYIALKGHIQQVRHNVESDPIPVAKENEVEDVGLAVDESSVEDASVAKLLIAIDKAKIKIKDADEKGKIAIEEMKSKSISSTKSEACKLASKLYMDAFAACADVLELDRLNFQVKWFKSFYRRNYDALMVKSIYDNLVGNVDRVRYWCEQLRLRTARLDKRKATTSSISNEINEIGTGCSDESKFSFMCIEDFGEQEIIDRIIDIIFYEEAERETIRNDPLVRLLISNPDGKYNFTIISAMGVITEGKNGQELSSALKRLEEKRGIKTIRADTGTARSIDFNASKIEEEVENAAKLGRPFGFLGYSQGCANALKAESMLLSGSPARRKLLTSSKTGLVCRQLLFSAANGSMHGPASDAKVNRLIVMGEEALKYQQGYFSRAMSTLTLNLLSDFMDSAPFQKVIGGAQGFLPEGCTAFWRDAQHLPHVPTCVLRGVLEEHTTPESLEMLSNILTKQANSPLHDSQVHVYDAVGSPMYAKNRNAHILKNCDMGGAIQRTHHWSPLEEEVEFVRTNKDYERGIFDCAKDRHVFPWVDVNARFGIIKYLEETD